MKALLLLTDEARLNKLDYILKTIGLEPIISQSKREAITHIVEDPDIEIVVCEFGSVDDHGFELLKFIKQSPRFKNIPVIMNCLHPTEELIKSAIEHGASDILSSPINDEIATKKFEFALDNGKPTIMVVEDEPLILELITRILRIERFSVIGCTNAEDALDKLKERKINIVLSDIHLPGRSGLELLVHVKEFYGDIPVILLTGKKGTYPEKDAMSRGADGFFAKPFKNTEVVGLIRQLTETH